MVDDELGQFGIRHGRRGRVLSLSFRTRIDELHTEEQAAPPYISYPRVLLLECLEFLDRMLAHHQRILLKFLCDFELW